MSDPFVETNSTEKYKTKSTLPKFLSMDVEILPDVLQKQLTTTTEPPITKVNQIQTSPTVEVIIKEIGN
jgi:hypothetical protein